MTGYVLRRILVMIPVFLGATLLIYGMVFLLPGDPIVALGGDRPLSPGRGRAAARAVPPGPAVLDAVPALPGRHPARRLRRVVLRCCPSVTFWRRHFRSRSGWRWWRWPSRRVFGIGFGVIAGLRTRRLVRRDGAGVSLVVIAIPIFVLGFLAQFVFGVRLGIAPVDGGDEATFGRLLLPGIVLGSVSFAYVVRLTRSAVADNAQADWVRTATANGLSRPRVVARAHPAQLADSGGDVPGRRPGRADGRCHRHRGHLQHPRRRRRALPGGHPPGGADRGRRS